MYFSPHCLHPSSQYQTTCLHVTLCSEICFIFVEMLNTQTRLQKHLEFEQFLMPVLNAIIGKFCQVNNGNWVIEIISLNVY